VDPLAPEYPWYTPYQFAGNMPIWAIDRDGLEPFFVHGTGQDETWWDWSIINDIEIDLPILFKNYGTPFKTDNTVWNGSLNHDDRFTGGKNLANFVMANRNNDEPITLIGHSHGGNVVIYAAHALIIEHGVNPKDINLVLINTPDRTFDYNYGYGKDEKLIDKNTGKETIIRSPFYPHGDVNAYWIETPYDLVQSAGHLSESPQTMYRRKLGIGNVIDFHITYRDQIPSSHGSYGFADHIGPADANFKVWFPKLFDYIINNRKDLYPYNESSTSPSSSPTQIGK
jgi:pimeloyl-ACP methyl ester carboxylesterase